MNPRGPIERFGAWGLTWRFGVCVWKSDKESHRPTRATQGTGALKYAGTIWCEDGFVLVLPKGNKDRLL